jgi:Ion transport protein
MNGADYAPD